MLDLGIAGRKAIVCGSSRGLGRASAEALARAGAIVVVNGIDAARRRPRRSPGPPAGGPAPCRPT